MKSKEKKSKKRRLLLSLLLLCLTGVILSTSTYAWFTANKTVTVSEINVNVASTNGVQVSVDGINWKTVISNSDITGANNTYSAAVNQLPSETAQLSPVSTIGEIDTTAGKGFIKMFTGEIDSNASGSYILTAQRNEEVHGTSGNFIAFDLFVQVTEATQLYFTPNSNVTVTGTGTGIENAARMAFVVQGNTAAGSATDTIQGMKATKGDESVMIWELNNDAHTAAGVTNAATPYGQTTSEGTGNDPLEYYGVKAPIEKSADIPLNSKDSNLFAKVTPTFSTTSDGISADDHLEFMQLNAGITKLRIYMWVEGQDVDCENNASGGSITFNLQLSSNESSS